MYVRIQILLIIGDVTTEHFEYGAVESLGFHVLLGVIRAFERIRYSPPFADPDEEL